MDRLAGKWQIVPSYAVVLFVSSRRGTWMGVADVKAKRKATKVAMEKMDIAFIIRQLKVNVQVYQSVFGVCG
jgi:hypothetical protein